MTSQRSPVFGALAHPSMVDFPGRIAVVLLTTGCNFSCGFCHNASLLGQSREGYPWDELARLCRRHRAKWVDGAVVSGGEPTLAPELPRLVEVLREHGFQVKLDTNGSRPQVLHDLLPDLGYIAMDIKCAVEHYASFVDFPDTGRIRESIRLLLEHDGDYEFRTTILPDIHTDDELHRMGREVQGAQRFVVQPFVPRDTLPDETFRTKPRTPPDALIRAGDILKQYVKNVVIRGT